MPVKPGGESARQGPLNRSRSYGSGVKLGEDCLVANSIAVTLFGLQESDVSPYRGHLNGSQGRGSVLGAD